MTAEQVFSFASTGILAGWLVLAFAIVRRNAFLRDQIAGRAFPLGMAMIYSTLILFFFKADGGFGTLAEVKLLFTNDWAALAGWVHYLAFDLFVGAWIARRVMEQGLPRLTLFLLLPTTFLFGPLGFLLFEIAQTLLRPSSQTTSTKE